MTEWNKNALGELISAGDADLQTGPFGTMLKSSEYTESGTPVIAVQDIGENKFHQGKLVYIATEIAQRLNKYRVLKGDIVFGRKGAVDRRAIVSINEDGWIQGSDCIRLRLNKKVCSEFVSYQLGGRKIKEWLIQHSQGATMPSLNQEILKLLPLILPPLPEQKAIASVLSSLDDKIDLLHRQNKTLESMAETLFRQWFVEEAVENQKILTLSEIAEHVKISIRPVPHTQYSHYSIPSFDETHGPLIELGEEIKSNKYQVIPNSILISKLNPRFPRVLNIPDRIGENSICSTEFQVVFPKKPKWYSFIYNLLKSQKVTSELIGAAGGTSGSHQRVRPNVIFGVEFPKPDDERIDKFNSFTEINLIKINSNRRQIILLESLRDSLLPKLMSGEVRIQYENVPLMENS